MFYLLLLLLLVLFIFLMKITIIIRAVPDKIKVDVVIFKLIKISLIDKTNVKRDMLKSSKSLRRTVEKLQIKKGTILPILIDLKNPLKKLAAKLQVDLKVRVAYGLSSPDKTAISYGLLNSLLYSLHPLLCKKIGRYNGSYSLIPDLKKPCFEYTVEARVCFRIFNLITSIIQISKILLKHIKLQKRKEGMKDGRASHRKLNENYNG